MEQQKKISPLLSAKVLAAVLMSCFPAGAALCLASYSDLPELNRYYAAVDFLSSAGIITGYPDGTFHPEKTVNRAEFLKLALKSAGIAPDATALPGFSDIDISAWYAPYVGKALKEGWIQGYPDNTFHPENPITKAEALKIIGNVREWALPPSVEDPPFEDTASGAWYSPYVAYAKSRNFLEETGRFFIPESHLTRGGTAEIIYRNYVTDISGADIFSTRLAFALPENETLHESAPEPPAEESAPVRDFTPVDYKTIPSDFFDGVILNEPFPNTFYLNEIYLFEGTVINSDFDRAFVFLAPDGISDTAKFTNNIGEINGTNLRIPVVFRKTGNYRLGLIPGTSGESAVADISVLPSLPAASSAQKNTAPVQTAISYGDGVTKSSWQMQDGGLVRITVSQGTRTVRYLNRQGINSLNLEYRDFHSFSEGAARLTVERAPLESQKPLRVAGQWSAGAEVSFNAVNHNFSDYETDQITVSALPETYAEGQVIRFSGMAKTDLFADAAITLPDGSVRTTAIASPEGFGAYYGSTTIPAGRSFSFAYKTTLPGTYIIEINSIDGEAALNHPVYLSGKIPLIPDFFDLSLYEQPETYFNLQEFRKQMLNLINAERKKAGLAEVAADPSLNNLAQAHSDDMVARNFFGHINPDGETPDDRRIEAGIPTKVGENLAQAPSLLYTHYGLMRSGIHRKNTLDPAWTKVGIGITRDSDGQLFTAEEFSGNPLTEIDMAAVEKEILEKINDKRRSLGIATLEADPVLSPVCDAWSAKMVSQDFFDFVSPNGESLQTLVRDATSYNAVQAIILETSDREKLLEQALSGDNPINAGWRQLGIGVKVDGTGALKATLLYSA